MYKNPLFLRERIDSKLQSEIARVRVFRRIALIISLWRERERGGEGWGGGGVVFIISPIFPRQTRTEKCQPERSSSRPAQNEYVRR